MGNSASMESPMSDTERSILTSAVLAIMGIVFLWLQEDNPLSMFRAAAERLKNINQTLACTFHTSTTVLVRFEIGALLGFGFTMMQIGEWMAAITCWVLLGIILFSKALAWEGVKSSAGLSRFLRFFYAFGAVTTCVLLITITDLRKPDDEPWSNLEKIGHKSRQDFSVRVSSVVVNNVLPLWSLDNVDKRDNYYCSIASVIEMFITNNQHHSTMITKLQVESEDISGVLRQLSVINTELTKPLYVGSNLKNVIKWEVGDGKYLDQQIKGRNISPGDTVSGSLFLSQDGKYELKGTPLRVGITDLDGKTYVVDVPSPSSNIPTFTISTGHEYLDLTGKTKESCPGWYDE